MPLIDELGLDLGTIDAGQIEEQMKSGGLPPKGYYHAQIIGIRPGTATTGTKYNEFEFEILTPGAFRGYKFRSTLYHPKPLTDHPTEEEKQKYEKGKNKVVMYMHRLGILTKDGNKYKPVPGKSEFTDVLYTTCIVNLNHRPWKTDDGKEGVSADLAFEGVLSLDDDRVKNVPRGNAAAAASAAASGAAAAKKKEDFSDL